MQSLHQDQLQTLTEHPNQPVGLWLPAEKFSLLEVPTPTAPKRKWPSLLPWLLEDQVLEPVEKLHFTITSNDNGLLKVLVIARRELDAVLEQTQGFNLQVQKIQPDYLALPWQKPQEKQPDSIVLAWRLSGSSRVLIVRYGESEGFAAPETMAEHLLDRLITVSSEKTGQIPALHACMPEEALPGFLKAKAVTCGPAPDWQTPMSSSFNMLHDDYALTSDKGSLAQWWPSAALAVLALGLAWGWLKVDTMQLEQRRVALEEVQSSQFSRLFPGVRDDDDIRGTLEALQSDRFRQSERLREPLPGLMQLLDVVLSDCNCSLESIDLVQSEGTLVFSAPPPRMSAFDNLYGVTTSSSQDENGQTRLTLQRSTQ